MMSIFTMEWQGEIIIATPCTGIVPDATPQARHLGRLRARPSERGKHLDLFAEW